MKRLFVALLTAAFGHTAQAAYTDDAVEVVCTPDWLGTGVYIIRIESITDLRLVRDQSTGEFIYGLLSWQGYDGPERIMIPVNTYDDTARCILNAQSDNG